MEQQGEIVVKADTINGTVGFIINGEDFGPAWTDKEKFCDGDLWPAIACIDSEG